MRITKTGIAAATLTAVLGIGAAVPALAQSDDSATQNPTTGDTNRDAWLEERAARSAERQEAFATALAGELDLDPATVSAALERVHEQLAAEHANQREAMMEERLAEAVEDGALTQEQADALREAAEEGVLGFGERGDRRGAGPRGSGHGVFGLDGFRSGGPGGFGPAQGTGAGAPPAADSA